MRVNQNNARKNFVFSEKLFFLSLIKLVNVDDSLRLKKQYVWRAFSHKEVSAENSDKTEFFLFSGIHLKKWRFDK